MPDRNQRKTGIDDEQAPLEGQGGQPDSGRDDGLEQNPRPDESKSTASRPRGHTEEPDRTL